MHKPGLVVVQRQPSYTTQPASRSKRTRPKPQWTLHTADCRYVQGKTARKMLPAPIVAYPGTVACKHCNPANVEECGNGQP